MMMGAPGETEVTQLLGWNNRDVKNQTMEVRQGFVRKVYGILTTQLIVTVIVAYQIWKGGQDREWLRSHEWMLWVSVFATFVTVCAMACCRDMCRRFPTNYLFLFTFTAFEGVMIGFVSALFTWQSLLLATATTMLVFVAFTLYAFNTKTDFTGMGMYVFGAGVVLMIFGFVVTCITVSGVTVPLMVGIYDIVGILIFTFYIVFDTQLIMGSWGGHRESFQIDDYCFAALNLYMDIVNLFLHVLSLLGERRV
jgi:FtsH-binding integral membrane protein